MYKHRKLKLIVIFVLGLSNAVSFAQEDDKEQLNALKESKNLTWEGNKDLSENRFIEAEVDYRKAIAKSDKNPAAPFNLGNAYYNNATYSEAFGRFKQAGELASEKPDKHKAYHNMGNVFMKRKEYQKAVEAYKEALRNNPKDEETRYNLALAKEMLKKEQDKNDQNKEDENQKDKNDQKDKNEDQKENDDKQEQKDQDKEGEEGDQQDENKEDNKEGDGDKKEEQKKQPEEGDKKEEQPRRPNQLSKQQIQNLLEAMQQEEKKVQEKIDAKKIKGVKVKNEKDW
ncbi:tetratricopeptide repeat protein [Flavobacteriaceae bacterium TP-CH-4]|uniref:Tetratricopeptide repeat protein n=1 Tax=Pelagihabitans pacificus TaxID=2696054 RepID=A0A967ARM0_9FLAO|nr:tetratricopeptide repeat protein [Pelagihabitans pacificus]